MSRHKVDLDKVKKLFKKSLPEVAKSLGLPIDEIRQAQFFEYDNEDINYSHLKSAGGFTNLKNLYFPKQVDAPSEIASKLVKKQVNDLKKHYGNEIFLKEEFEGLLKEIMKDTPIKIYKTKSKAKKTAVSKRTRIVHLSDIHIGANIAKDEMGGINEFNNTIAARRLAKLADQVVNYKQDHIKDSDVVIIINGDILAGLIHNQEWFVDLLTTQVSASMRLLTQFISYIATYFSKVTVYCTTGNHGRNIAKASKDRATVHKWDSYETMVYVGIKNAFELAKVSNVDVIIPESPYAIFDVQGHRMMATHGDTVINSGNVGRNINMDSIKNQVNNMNIGLMKKGQEDFKVVFLGHVHTCTVQIMDNGCYVFINGPVVGSDPYAQSINIFGNNPVQQLVEVTKDHPVGDMRFINLIEADNNEELDKIIEPFKRKF